MYIQDKKVQNITDLDVSFPINYEPNTVAH